MIHAYAEWLNSLPGAWRGPVFGLTMGLLFVIGMYLGLFATKNIGARPRGK